MPALANFTFYQGQDMAAEQMESMAGATVQDAADACLAKMGCTGFTVVGGAANLKSGAGEQYPLEEAKPCDGYWMLVAAEATDGPGGGTQVPGGLGWGKGASTKLCGLVPEEG